MEVIYKNALSQLINFLEKIEKDFEVKYYLVGGVLTGLYSNVRSTSDIDFVVDLAPSKLIIEKYVKP